MNSVDTLCGRVVAWTLFMFCYVIESKFVSHCFAGI